MKLAIVTFALSIFSFCAMAQTEEMKSEEIYDVVEEQPEYPGGASEMYRYIANNLTYPAEAVAKKAEGRVYVQFVVGKTGKVEQVKVIRSPHEELNAEAIRVIREMPVWEPGTQRGRAVAVKMVIPISFNL